MLDTAARQTASDPAASKAGRRDWRRRVLRAAMPGLTYLVVRHVGVLILAVLAAANGRSLTQTLTSWDGQWYLAIAAGGYTDPVGWLTDAAGHRSAATPYAFFPGYPALVHLFTMNGLVGLLAAAFFVTVVSGIVAAYGIHRLGTLTPGGSRRVGLVLVALFAASPMGVVLSMTYSEALFCAAAAWTLVFLLQRRWVAAGLVCATAGLVRPTALALIATVFLAAVAVMFARRRLLLRPLVAVILAPAGLAGYLLWAGSRLRPGAGASEQLGAWSALQRSGWGSRFDWGAATLRFATGTLMHSESALNVVTVFVLLGAFALVALCIWRQIPWQLIVYGLAVLIMDVGSNGLMNSKARLLVPAFTLLVPVAVGLARRRPATVVLVLCALTVVSGWFGAHALVAWRYAI